MILSCYLILHNLGHFCLLSPPNPTHESKVCVGPLSALKGGTEDYFCVYIIDTEYIYQWLEQGKKRKVTSVRHCLGLSKPLIPLNINNLVPCTSRTDSQ